MEWTLKPTPTFLKFLLRQGKDMLQQAPQGKQIKSEKDAKINPEENKSQEKNLKK